MRRRNGGLALASAAVVFSCSEPTVLETRWSSDQLAVLVVTDAMTGRALASPELVRGDGPSSLMVSPAEGGRAKILARVFEPPSRGGPELERCGVTIGGEAERLPREAAAFVSDEIEGGHRGRISLHDDPAPVDLDLKFATRCAPPKMPFCDELHPRTRSLEAIRGTLETVAVLPGGTVLTSGAHGIWSVDERGEVAVVQAAARGRAPWRVAFDPTARAAFALSADGVLLVFDEFARVVRTGSVALSRGTIAVGTDGTALAYGPEGVFALSPTSSAAVARTGDFPPGVTRLAVWSRARMIAIAGGLLHTFDGARWTEEPYSGPEVERATDLVIDDRMLAVIGLAGVAIVEQPGAEWRRLPDAPPLTGVEIHAGLPLGSNRLFIAGETGGFAVWDGEEWCGGASGTSESFNDLDLYPGDPRTIAGVTSSPGAFGPLLMTIPL